MNLIADHRAPPDSGFGLAVARTLEGVLGNNRAGVFVGFFRAIGLSLKSLMRLGFDMRVLVDEPHYRGHTNCSQGYNTGAGLQKPLDCGIIPSLVLTVLHVHHVIECLARRRLTRCRH